MVLPWAEVLRADFPLADALSKAGGLRLESPGENFGVERRLIELGAREAEREGIWPWLSAEAAAGLMEDHGRLRWQRQWYHGWVAALNGIGEAARAAGVPVMNEPEDIAVMFDKAATQTRLAAAGVPVATGLGICRDFGDLRERMLDTGMKRVFLKPCHSSSASGVVALRTDGRGRWQAVTSAVMEGEGGGIRVRNSLRLSTLREEVSIRALVDALARERLMAEEWIPKDSLHGRTYDLRVLVIAGRACHVVVRGSFSPLTNLHLGNARGDPEALRARLGPQRWEEAMKVAEKAAGAFSACHYAGVDLMVDSCRRHFVVAEVNAFGDLLPRVLWNGMDTWEAELQLWPGTNPEAGKTGRFSPGAAPGRMR